MMHFDYGEKEIEYLKKKDKKLGRAIDIIGHVDRPIDNDVFVAIIRAILGQQVSRQARETVFKRLKDSMTDISAENINALSIDTLQAFGTTFKKAEYMKDFALNVCIKGINLDELSSMSDKEVINKLCEIKGIGIWTAEMLLASALKRPDILSYRDIAIHRGIRMLYRHTDVSKERFEKYRKRYSPYGTTASVYLWAIAAGAIEELSDPKTKKHIKSSAKHTF